MSSTTSLVPVVAEDRDHTSARTPAIASHSPARVSVSSWWKCGAMSSPTGPTRTGSSASGDVRCRCRPPRHRPASTSPAPEPCRGHGPGPAHQSKRSTSTANHQPRDGPQSCQERADQRERRRPRRPLPPPPEPCSYHSPRRCPPGLGVWSRRNVRSLARWASTRMGASSPTRDS